MLIRSHGSPKTTMDLLVALPHILLLATLLRFYYLQLYCDIGVLAGWADFIPTWCVGGIEWCVGWIGICCIIAL
ncbi:hypothetical protein Gotur_013449, partial [Gossypium turneri]